MNVIRWDKKENGEPTEEKLREYLENQGYHVAKYTYSPGTYFPDHTHTIDKMDAVLAGKFKMTTKQGSVVLEAGDILEVPRGTVHSAEVVGSQSVVSLDATRG